MIVNFSQIKEVQSQELFITVNGSVWITYDVLYCGSNHHIYVTQSCYGISVFYHQGGRILMLVWNKATLYLHTGFQFIMGNLEQLIINCEKEPKRTEKNIKPACETIKITVPHCLQLFPHVMISSSDLQCCSTEDWLLPARPGMLDFLY